MALLTVILAGLAVGASAYALTGVDFASLSVTKRPKSHLELRESLQSACEFLGHQRVVAHASRFGAARGFAMRLRGALGAHGYTVTPEGAFAGAVALGALLGFAGWFVSLSVLGAAVGIAAAAALSGVFVGRYERKLVDVQAAQMPEVLRSLSSALGSGKSLAQAIEHVGRNVPEPLGSEFLRASLEIKGGSTVEEAVSSLCGRVRAPGVSLLGTALQISQRTGAPLGDLFSRTSRMVTETVDLRRELQVKTSQVRLSARVVAAMPVILCGVLVLLSGDYRVGVALPAGRACLAMAALLDVTALLLVRRTMARSLR